MHPSADRSQVAQRLRCPRVSGACVRTPVRRCPELPQSRCDAVFPASGELAQPLLKATCNRQTRGDCTMIRDTTAQDRRIETTTQQPRRRWVVIGAAGAAVLAALIWVVPTVARLISVGASVNSASVRIA